MSILGMMLAVFLWGALPAFLVRRKAPKLSLLLIWNGLGFLLLLLQAGLLSTGAFASDSLWTLEPPARAGLAALTSLLLFGGAWLAFRAAMRIRTLGRTQAIRLLALPANLVLTAACTLALFLLLPQIYYQYYRLVIPGLPQQWVPQGSGGFAEILAALSFDAESRLSDLASGGAFWLFLSLTVSVHAMAWRRGR